MRKLKYKLNQLRWIKALFSPFKPFKVRWYVGKTQVGVPYFLPRKTVKSKTKPGYLEFKPLKFGFSYCGLGWKTKWDRFDFRHEWNPVISFVFFGYQIAVTFGHEYHSHYWESWLCYEYRSDKKKSKHKRIAFCRRKSPQTWSTGSGENKVTTDYWDLILKPKYLKQKDK